MGWAYILNSTLDNPPRLPDGSVLPVRTPEDRKFIEDFIRRHVWSLIWNGKVDAEKDDQGNVKRPLDVSSGDTMEAAILVSGHLALAHQAYKRISTRIAANPKTISLGTHPPSVDGIPLSEQVSLPDSPGLGGSPILFREKAMRSIVYEATASDPAWLTADPARLEKLTERRLRAAERMVHQVGLMPKGETRRMFDFPPSSDPPAANPGAKDCWPLNPKHDAELDCRLCPQANTISAAIDLLFKPSKDYAKRNHFYCDHVVMALLLEAVNVSQQSHDLPEDWLDSERRNQPPELRDRWVRIAPQVDIRAGDYFVGAIRESPPPRPNTHFVHKRVPEYDLQVGDHVIFWNHPIYPVVLPDSPWGNENALVVETVPHLKLQGHGVPANSPDAMRDHMLRTNLIPRLEELRRRMEDSTTTFTVKFNHRAYELDKKREVYVIELGYPLGYQRTGADGWWVVWRSKRPWDADLLEDRFYKGTLGDQPYEDVPRGEARIINVERVQKVHFETRGYPKTIWGSFPLAEYQLGSASVGGWTLYIEADQALHKLAEVTRPGE